METETNNVIIGVTRIRNESDIIEATLDHVAKLVDFIVVVDDCSADNTVEICKAHPKVLEVIKNKEWAADPVGRRAAEGDLRTVGYKASLKYIPDWIYYFDADEIAYFEGIDFDDKEVDAWRLRLFDFYITPEDVDAHYLDRKMIGAEYRDILMVFRPHKDIVFGEREPNLPQDYRIKTGGCVKHYGKAISVEEWESTCDYYIHNRGGDVYTKFRDKWKARKGKAIHTQSDFGSDLIKWEDRNEFGFPLID